MLKEQKCRSVSLTYSKLFSGGRNPEEITSSLSSPELFIFSLEKLNSFSESSPTSGCLNICINAGNANSKTCFNLTLRVRSGPNLLPEIYNENQSISLGIIDNFVLETIIYYRPLSWFPSNRLVSNLHVQVPCTVYKLNSI